MFYLYFPFSLMASVVLFTLFIHKKTPLWTVVLALLAPVTAPYFWVRANPGSSLKHRVACFVVFYLCLVLVGTGELYLFSQEKARLAMARHSPVERQMIHMSQELRASTLALDKAVKALASSSKIMSKRRGVGQILSHIGLARVKMIRNNYDVERFLSFIRDYREILGKEGGGDFLVMEDFFINPIVKAYRKGLENYLAAFESLLNYAFDNFGSIDDKSPQHLKNYDAYYMEYIRAVDRHRLVSAQRIAFQRTFVEKHPGLGPYLPTMNQTDFLKVWE